MTALSHPSVCVSPSPNSPSRGPSWVTYIVLTVIAAGILDLWLTVHAMSGPGMIELNPIARLLVEQSLGALITFKLLMISINAIPMWLWRHRRIAQVASIVSLAIMLLVLSQWVLWHLATHQLEAEVWRTLADDSHWIRLE